MTGYDPIDPYDLTADDWSPAELDQLRLAVRNRETLQRDQLRRQALDTENSHRRQSRRWQS